MGTIAKLAPSPVTRRDHNEGPIMALYEHVIMSRPDLSSAQVEDMINTLGKTFEELGGSIGKTEYWGLRNLAYRVKKNRKAHYSLVQIDAPATAIHEVERRHRINDDILRYLTIRVDEHSEEQSPILIKREERKKRERRD